MARSNVTGFTCYSIHFAYLQEVVVFFMDGQGPNVSDELACPQTIGTRKLKIISSIQKIMLTNNILKFKMLLGFHLYS